jgi:hypothetical protein
LAESALVTGEQPDGEDYDGGGTVEGPEDVKLGEALRHVPRREVHARGRIKVSSHFRRRLDLRVGASCSESLVSWVDGGSDRVPAKERGL